MKKNFILTLLLTILISLTACKELDGTDVDNPFWGGQEEPCQGGKRCMPTPYIDIQAGVICKKVDQCLGVAPGSPQETCTQNIFEQTGLEVFINTPATNYSQLKQLYNKKELLVNSKNWNDCLAAIDALDCGSQQFTNAFNINDPQNYSNIHQILLSHEMCVNIYSVTN